MLPSAGSTFPRYFAGGLKFIKGLINVNFHSAISGGTPDDALGTLGRETQG